MMAKVRLRAMGSWYFMMRRKGKPAFLITVCQFIENASQFDSTFAICFVEQ
jgi:hypothetical protein